ncbi:zinc-binding oxidoreductase CipB [Stachybotrys elegans]|uniref:Zinc-binding oxidoreductase CipB n=1 Tax=Stachybotrys elegans TaxID=80388 RepID=A0A8K0SUI9_9HYPO|nr:zinc-binding oxidoreductase CipB [Stachybotrys elegans]
MATQSGLVFTAPGSPLNVVDNLPRLHPERGQVLIKPEFVALCPVDSLMAQTGAFVTDTPAVLGSGFYGTVTEVGFGCARLKEGDLVFGLGSLGRTAYSPFQDSFLIDERLPFRKGKILSPQDAASLGVSLTTAALGIFAGRHMLAPKRSESVRELQEWVVILGGSGNVGQCAIQLGRFCGFKIAASCSLSNRKTVVKNGAHATFDSRATVEKQVAEVLHITHGNEVGHFMHVFDASGVGHDVAFESLKRSTENFKFFSTVDASGSFAAPAPIKEYRVQAGMLSYPGDKNVKDADEVARMAPVLDEYIENGDIRPAEFDIFDGVGWGALKDALGRYNPESRKTMVVRVQ